MFSGKRRTENSLQSRMQREAIEHVGEVRKDIAAERQVGERKKNEKIFWSRVPEAGNRRKVEHILQQMLRRTVERGGKNGAAKGRPRKKKEKISSTEVGRLHQPPEKG